MAIFHNIGDFVPPPAPAPSAAWTTSAFSRAMANAAAKSPTPLPVPRPSLPSSPAWSTPALKAAMANAVAKGVGPAPSPPPTLTVAPKFAETVSSGTAQAQGAEKLQPLVEQVQKLSTAFPIQVTPLDLRAPTSTRDFVSATPNSNGATAPDWRKWSYLGIGAVTLGLFALTLRKPR